MQKIFLFVPEGRPAENLRDSFLPAACRGGGCAERPGSPRRCPGPETELSGPRGELVPPSRGSTAADAPTLGREKGQI